MKKLHIHGLLLLMCSALCAQEKPTAPLVQASKEQQKSISQLVYALKEVQKAFLPPGQPAPPQEKKENPFKDKQEYKNKPPENELQQLLKRQKDVIDQLKEQEKQAGQQSSEGSPEPQPGSQPPPAANDGQRKSGDQSPSDTGNPQPGSQPPPNGNGQKSDEKEKPSPDKSQQPSSPDKTREDLIEKQQGISDDLKKLSENEELDPSVRQALQDAVEASDKTSEAMKNAADTEAKVGAQKTMAKIKQAMQELGKDARKRSEEALDEAARKLAEAEQARQSQNGKEAAEKVDEAQKTLDDAAQAQKRAGSQSAEKTLAALAEKMKDGELVQALTDKPGEQATADKLAEMREAVAKARQGDKTAREEMEAAAQALKKLKQEMKYQAKRPQELTDNVMSNLLSQSSGVCNRIGRSASQMGNQGQGNGNRSTNSMESDVREVEQMAGKWSNGSTDTPDREITLNKLLELSDRILAKMQQTLAPLEKETVVRNLAKDEVPEKYQDDVATYFKRLSEPDKKQP